MMTLRQLAAEPLTLPTQTTWYLTDLAEARGKQELFTRQSPQKLKLLREHALIESAVSSNRIEGVEVDQSRVATLLFGKSAFRDRDGRVSRLLFLLACYHCGIEAGRYISLERLIEDNKERYYEVLEQSSRRWHEGKHDPWPTINFLLYTLTRACKEFEERVGQMASPRGAKTDMVEHAIETISGEFSITDVERLCPGVSRDMIRLLLRDLKAAGRVECLGRGPGAKWRKRVLPLKKGNKEGSKRNKPGK
ncbi:MAG: hypothetical protein JSS39_04365 [Nitrospira sp.]|nr:hypothetical protein [Nitrospira sp.]